MEIKVVNGWLSSNELEIDKTYPSPNFWKGWKEGRPCGVLIHYTGWGNEIETLEHFRRSKVSAHFLIGRTGKIWQCVSIDNRAWHAGKSEFRFRGEVYKNLNHYFIGIEVANWGELKRVDDELYAWPPVVNGKEMYRFNLGRLTFTVDYVEIENRCYEQYRTQQVKSLKELLQFLRDYDEIPETHIVGHSDVTDRKKDPGPHFPWEQVLEFGNLEFLEEKQGNRKDC